MDSESLWQANQDAFELHQLQKSSILRVIDGRAASSDHLMAVPALLQPGFEYEAPQVPQLKSPLEVLDATAEDRLYELLEHTKRIQSLDRRELSRRYWEWVAKYIQTRIDGDEDDEAVQIVEQDILEVLQAQSVDDLSRMESEISRSDLANNPEFWNHVLWHIRRQGAQKLLSDLHARCNKIVSDAPMIEPPKDSPFRRAVMSRLQPNEMLFDSILDRAERLPEYVNRVILGKTANYQAHVFAEEYLSNRVQGYKFSIYYPNLSDSTQVPRFKVHKNGDGTANIAFYAPGYPDLAFRILDEPWDKPAMQTDRYVSQFDNAVISLEFRFKSYYYKN